MSVFGIRYVIIGLGSPKEPASDDDVKGAAAHISRQTGLTAVHLSESSSDKLAGIIMENVRAGGAAS